MDYNPDGDDQDAQDWEVFAGRNGTLFLVDCATLSYGNNGEHFKEGLTIIRSMMMNGIIANEKDMLGIVLFNVENTPAPVDEIDSIAIDDVYKNVAIFMNLKQTSSDSVKFIHRYVENDLYDFTTKYGHCDTNSRAFIDSLWLCTKLFKSSDYKLETKMIYVMTANPEPFVRGSVDERNAYKKAKDLNESGIEFTVVPFSDTFELDPFYGQFYLVVNDEELNWSDLNVEGPREIRDLLMNRTFCPNYRKRSIGRVKVQICKDTEISVAIYPTSRKAKPPKRVYMTKDTNEIITSKIAHMVGEPDECRAVLPGDQMRFIEIGNEEIAFTNTEFHQLRRLMQPGIKIIGFKDASTVKMTQHLRRPLFIYPDDAWIKGSVSLFTALWQQCKAKDKVAYAIMVSRLGTYPKLVALVPQDAHEEENFARSDGFRVEFIPYKENIRALDTLKEIPVEESSPEELEIMKRVVKGLKYKFHPSQFINPAVTYKYTQIESTILDEEPDDLKDSTIPEIATQDERLEGLIEEFSELFGGDVAVAEKRKPTAAAGPKAKTQKKNDVVDVLDYYKQGLLSKLTVDQLKTYLAENGESGLSKLKKNDLIEKVETYIVGNKLA